jgi:hypothetical protein
LPQNVFNKEISTPNSYSKPKRVENQFNDDGYETPSFIHKKEAETPKPSETQGDMKKSMEKDIETFLFQFDNAKDKKDRIEICNNL